MGKEGFVQKQGLTFDLPENDRKDKLWGLLSVEILVRPDDRILHPRNAVCAAGEAVADAQSPPKVSEAMEEGDFVDEKQLKAAVDFQRLHKQTQLRKKVLQDLARIKPK